MHRHLKRLAGVPFHAYLWSVLIVMLFGNCVVVLWRCTRSASQRSSVLSLIIVNLAVVDFLYGVHLLLIETTLSVPVFGGGSHQHHLDSNTAVDHALCYTAYFLSLLSCAAQAVALASIATYWILSLSCLLQPAAEKAFVAGSILTQWALALVLSSISTFHSEWQVPWNMSYNVTENEVNVQIYYVLTQCSYSGTLDPSIMPLVTMELALVSLTTVLYVSVLFRLARTIVLGSHQSLSEDTKFLTIRLCVILAVNILCWGPPLVLFYFGKKTMPNVLMLLKDSYCLSITEVTVILLSIPPAANPLIYTLITKQFLGVLKKVCFTRHGTTRLTSESGSEISETASLFSEHNSTNNERPIEDNDFLISDSGEHSTEEVAFCH